METEKNEGGKRDQIEEMGNKKGWEEREKKEGRQEENLEGIL